MVTRRRPSLILGIALMSQGLMAGEPPVQRHDEKGNLIYSRSRDEKTNTERVFDRGVWMTNTYDEKNRTQLRKVEAPGETHEFSYKGTRVTGRTAQLGNTTLSITAKSSGWTSATGLQDILVRTDGNGDVQEIATASGPLATFTFDKSGRGSEITLRGGQRLVTEVTGDTVRETLYASKGNILFSSTFSQEARKRVVSKFNLDLLTTDLGLSYEWGKGLSLNPSATGFSESVVRGDEAPIVRFVRGVQVGRGMVDLICSGDGKPLGYVVNLFGMMHGTPAAPWRVVITPDDGISLEAPNGQRGSVISFWSRGRVSGYRVEKLPAAGTPTPLLLALCDTTEVCSSSGSTETCTITYYWCAYDSGGGGGGGWGGYDDVGAVGGGGTRPDGAPLNGSEQTKVSDAESNAFDRLNRPECLGLFSQYGQPPKSGQGIANMSKSYVRGATGSVHCPNSNVMAATEQNSNETYLCTGFFSNLTVAERAITLIHEAVHTAGLGEGHSGMSSQAFQDLVASRCP